MEKHMTYINIYAHVIISIVDTNRINEKQTDNVL